MKETKFNKLLFISSFTIYMLLLVWVIVFKWTLYYSVEISINNFRHLDLVTRYQECFPWFFYFEATDLFLNIFLFIPLGLFYLLPLKRKYLILPIGFLLTLIFEISQFFTCIGMFNIYDLLGNMLGVSLGFILFNIFKKSATKKLIDTANIVVTALLSPVVIYAIYMTIKNIDVYI